jgi:hypothetical protein
VFELANDVVRALAPLVSLAEAKASPMIIAPDRTSSSFLRLHFQFPGDSFGVGRVTNESLVILTISRLTGASQTARRRQSMKWESADGIQSILIHIIS